MLYFRNREQAGRQLSLDLVRYSADNPVVLGIPRGGVPVAFEIARALNAPLDVLVSQKLGVPGQEEFTFGAIAEGNSRFIISDVIYAARVSIGETELVTRTTAPQVENRARLYREGGPALHLQNQTVILVDDGIATGASMRAALLAVRKMNPRRLVVAAPIATRSACEELNSLVDRVVVLHSADTFYRVGKFYEKFPPMSDGEVRSLLKISEHFVARPASPAA